MLLILLCLATAPVQAASPAPAPASASASPAVTSALLAQYDVLRLALLADKLDASVAAAREIVSASAGDSALLTAATAVSAASDLATARTAFGELSRLLIQRLSSTSPAPKALVYYCPMFAGFPYWLQPKAGLANPYMGQSMPACGEETSLKVALKAANSTSGGVP